MLKKGEQIIIINDPAQAPVKFYHKRGGSELAIGSQLEGLSYPGNGTYFPVTGDNQDLGASPAFVTTTGSEANWERMSINGYNTQIDALRVLRAFKYVTAPEQVEQAAIQLSGTPAAVGTVLSLKLTIACTDRYLHEFNTVFSDGKIVIYRSFTVPTGGNTLAAIGAQIVSVFNNTEMRVNGENPYMNITALYGTANSVSTVTFTTALAGITIENIEITETPLSGAAVMTSTYVPARTALSAPLVTIVDNQKTFYGRGIYNIMRRDFPQTVNKIYPYGDETTNGTNRPYVGATYTAYLISVKVQSSTHGNYNTAPTEYFDYWIYVNNSCTAVLTSISSWLNSLSNFATTGRKVLLSAAGTADYAAAYTAWNVPQRLSFAAPTISTGVENVTTIATTAKTGM